MNDIPAAVARKGGAAQIAAMVRADFEEPLEQTARDGVPQGMGIAPHPRIIGQPCRLQALRGALPAMAAGRRPRPCRGTARGGGAMGRALMLAALLLGGCVSMPDATTPQPVPAVDLQRYLGTWYEVARLPMWAQDSSGLSCEDTTASYTLRPDGRIGVLNRCLNALDGDRPRAAEGQAYAVAGSSNARLRVSFFWPFYGNYWVIGLDPDYRWAVVGEPRRRWLWVLSRRPRLPGAEFEKALGIARANGYDLASLKVARR